MYQEGLVSIIIPCFNVGNYLAETLDSVLNQTYPNWECIIVNDGSNDSTETIAKKYCSQYPKINYIYQENSGLSAARNIGIKKSSGEYILPLDGDDLIDKTYIEKSINILTKNPNIKLVYCNAEKFGAQTGKWELPEYNYQNFIWKNCIFATSLYRRIDFDKTLGYNINMRDGLEDWDFLLTLLNPTDEVYKINETLFFYRIRQSSLYRSKTELNINKLLIQIFNNHKDIYTKYCENLLCWHREIEILKFLIEQQQITIKGFEDYKKTKQYKIGKLIATPFNWIRNLINKITK